VTNNLRGRAGVIGSELQFIIYKLQARLMLVRNDMLGRCPFETIWERLEAEPEKMLYFICMGQ